MLNVAMTEIRLKRPRVMPFVRQGAAAGVSEHARVSLEAEPSLQPDPLNHASEGSRRERRSALRREHEGKLWLLLVQ